MAITSVTQAPAVGTVGQPITLYARGTQAGNQLRWYIRSAPAMSALRTLDQYDTTFPADGSAPPALAPLPLSTTLADLRLKGTAANGATFTPDVAGTYTIEVRDVTTWNKIPHFGGDIPSSGQVSELDNETAALPAYAGGTAQAAVKTGNVVVAETHTCRIGFDPAHTATLAIRTYGSLVDPTPGIRAITLTPGSSALAKLAALDTSLAVIMREAMAAVGLSDLVVWTSSLQDLITGWNSHCLRTTWTVHGSTDATNVVTAPDCTNLATAQTLLQNIASVYNAHRVDVAGAPAIHAAADTSNAFSMSIGTTTADAIAYYVALYNAFASHATSATYHSGIAGYLGDGAIGDWTEATRDPQTLTELVDAANALSTAYTHHIAKVSQTAHANADNDNTVLAIVTGTTDVTPWIAAVNKWANSINNHTQNLKSDGSAASYHSSPGGKLVTNRASDKRTLLLTIAECIVASTAHMLDTSLHTHASLGAARLATWPYVLRVQRRWRDIVSAATPTAPANANALATALVGAGWTLFARVPLTELTEPLDARGVPAGVAALAVRLTDADDARIAEVERRPGDARVVRALVRLVMRRRAARERVVGARRRSRAKRLDPGLVVLRRRDRDARGLRRKTAVHAAAVVVLVPEARVVVGPRHRTRAAIRRARVARLAGLAQTVAARGPGTAGPRRASASGRAPNARHPRAPAPRLASSPGCPARRGNPALAPGARLRGARRPPGAPGRARRSGCPRGRRGARSARRGAPLARARRSRGRNPAGCARAARRWRAGRPARLLSRGLDDHRRFLGRAAPAADESHAREKSHPPSHAGSVTRSGRACPKGEGGFTDALNRAGFRAQTRPKPDRTDLQTVSDAEHGAGLRCLCDGSEHSVCGRHGCARCWSSYIAFFAERWSRPVCGECFVFLGCPDAEPDWSASGFALS